MPQGKLDPVVGRKKEIERVTQILGRRTKNNPCLVGEPGVGKTAVAEGLAQRIATGDVPETIDGKQVLVSKLFFHSSAAVLAHKSWIKPAVLEQIAALRGENYGVATRPFALCTVAAAVPALLTALLTAMQVVTLDMGLLVAGTKYRGEFEERLKKLMDEIKQNKDIILVRSLLDPLCWPFWPPSGWPPPTCWPGSGCMLQTFLT